MCQPRILYQVKISLKNEGEIKTFSCEVKLREFIASRLALKELLKEVFQTEGKQQKEKYQKEQQE